MINDNIEKVTKKYLNIENVDNTSDINKPISNATQFALDKKIDTSSKGVANGVASLDDNGKVPSSQLPSYVDDVLEGTLSTFPSVGESGKIYVDTATNKSYRWSGTTYVIISDTISLGTTSSTAYRGDYGNTAYLHSQSTHAPENAQKNSDITKAEIEAKLTGDITSHSHVVSDATNTTKGIVKLNTAIDSDSTTEASTPSAVKEVNDRLKTLEGDAVLATSIGVSIPTLDNPIFTGSFSQQRRADTVVGIYSHAEGYNTTASGDYSHAEGSQSKTTGSYSHSEGNMTTSSGESAHSEGYSTTASGNYSHSEGTLTKAEGTASHAEGSYSVATSSSSHAEGYHATASGSYSHAEGSYTTASNFASHACGKYNKAMVDGGGSSTKVGDVFVIGNGTLSTPSNAFRVTYTGETYGLAAFNASGADYAEYFEWVDMNPNNDDRIGHFVTLDGKKIKYANSESDYILGIVSGNPCIIGNSDEDWLGRWMHDEFGRFLLRDVTVPVTKTEYIERDNGTVESVEVDTGETVTGVDYVPNPEYNPDEVYIERKNRKEWSAIGMMGVLSVIDDGTCQVNGYCTVKEGGIATTSETGYRVIERKSDRVISIIFK